MPPPWDVDQADIRFIPGHLPAGTAGAHAGNYHMAAALPGASRARATDFHRAFAASQSLC